LLLSTYNVFESILTSPVTVNDVSVPTLVKLLDVTPEPRAEPVKTSDPLILYEEPLLKLAFPETSSGYMGDALFMPIRLFVLSTLSVFESILTSPVTVNPVNVPTLVKELLTTLDPSPTADKIFVPLI
jgi:hypothetical protein